jgi:hypothetical protein
MSTRNTRYTTIRLIEQGSPPLVSPSLLTLLPSQDTQIFRFLSHPTTVHRTERLHNFPGGKLFNAHAIVMGTTKVKARAPTVNPSRTEKNKKTTIGGSLLRFQLFCEAAQKCVTVCHHPRPWEEPTVYKLWWCCWERLLRYRSLIPKVPSPLMFLCRDMTNSHLFVVLV